MNSQAGLTKLAENVWTSADPVSIVGMPLTTTMTILRLRQSGALVVYSPVELTEERHAQVVALGRVEHIYAPNLFHHLHAAGWISAFPQAEVHAPAGLERKRPDLRIDRFHNQGGSTKIAEGVEELPIAGFRLKESALFHQDSGTLIVADLVQNIGKPEGVWTQTYTRLMGFYDSVALSRALRWTAFSDRGAARHSIETLLELPIERLIVGHGYPVLHDAGAALRRAYEFLPSQSPR